METESNALNVEQRAVRVSRLIELIRGEIAAIQHYEHAGNLGLEHQQWTELREEHLLELNELCKDSNPKFGWLQMISWPLDWIQHGLQTRAS